MPVTVKKKEDIVLSPFAMEADHPRNCDLLIQSIPNCRLRSKIKASRTTIVNPQSDTNEPVIPKDQAHHLGSLPTIPGMKLLVNPAKLSYEISDPLFENEILCDRIKSAMKSDDRPFLSDGVKGVPPQQGTLDVHRMKTLCREMANIIEAGEAVVCKGVKPDLEDVADLPGKFLLNPGSRVPNNQPTFEEDLSDYVNNLQKTGG